MTINVIKAWRGRHLDNPVIIFWIGSTRFSYTGTNNDRPLVYQTVGGGKLREHRRELSGSRYTEIKNAIEGMLNAGQVSFGPPPAI